MLEGCIAWPEEYKQLYRAKGYWGNVTLSETFEKSVEKYGSKVAFVCNGESLTYEQIAKKVNTLAYHFAQTGLKPLDKVIFQLPNSPELVIVFFALMKIGVIPIMALPPHRFTEVNHFVKFSDAVGYFIPAKVGKFDFRDMAEEVQKDNPCLKYVFVVGEVKEGQLSIDKMLESPIESEEQLNGLVKYLPDPEEVALMLLSGGTTALPKLIPRTHNDYVLNSKASGLVAEFNEDTVFLAVLPIAHNFTFASPGILAAFYYGGKVVVSPRVDAETVFPIIEKEKVTCIAAAVPLVINWLNSLVPAQYNIESLKVIQNGGMRMPQELRKRMIEQFKCIPQEVYGTAEGLLNMTRLDDTGDVLLNSSGAPVHDADEIKIIDDAGNEVPDGVAGELVTRGPYTINGYYKNPEANKGAFTVDGFYRMGDAVSKQGRYVYALGRKKDEVNRGGEKISCDEIENFVYAHPKVEKVALIAMPDEVYGEKGCLYVVPKVGETFTFDDLKDHLATLNIAKFKWPERLEVVDEFPLSNVGKILKRTLKEMITLKIEQEKARRFV